MYVYENLDDVFVDVNQTTNTSVWLNQNQIVSWDEFNNITSITFDSAFDCVKVRLHFRSNINLSSFEGLYVDSHIVSTNNKKVLLSSFIWNTEESINTSIEPLIMGESVYTKYLDIFVPIDFLVSLNSIYPDETFSFDVLYFSIGKIGDYNNINEVISSNLSTTFNYFQRVSIADFSYYNTDVIANNISCSITPIYDYFQLSVSVENSSLLTYINGLVDSSNYIVVNDINVYVQYENTYQLTDSISTIKYTEFNEEIRYRPIIKNSYNAISYKIKYTIKILNTNTNRYEEYESTYISFNPYRYGEKVQRLNLDSPIINKIYKQEVNNIIEYVNYENTNQPIKYETKYFDSYAIKVNGNANIIIQINNIASVIVFNLSRDGELIDLGNNTHHLIFVDINGDGITIPNKLDNDIDSVNGGLLFEISTDKAKQIILSNNKNFYISHNNSTLYNGNWSSSTTISTDSIFEENQLLKAELEKVKADNVVLTQQVNTQTLVTRYKDGYVRQKKQKYIPFKNIKL
jgi:hypothetical protein